MNHPAIPLEVGSVIATKSITAEIHSETSKTSLSFSAGRGNHFKVMLLGRDTLANPIDPKETLYSLGWFPLHPHAVPILQAHYEKELKKAKKCLKDTGATYSSHLAEIEKILGQLKQFASYDE